MNWRTLAIYCVSLIGCFFAFIAIDLACIEEPDPYDYYTSFFHNNILNGKEYNSFRFTNQLFLYSDEEPADEHEINAGEWAAYLGKGVTTADVMQAMYKLDSKTDSVLYNGYLNQKGTLPDDLSANTFLKALGVNKSALKYYRMAKGVEKIANVEYSNWDPKPMDTVALVTQGNLAFNSATTEKDKFLQFRYYYQAQRLLHYGAAYEQANTIYDKYLITAQTSSHIKGWAMALKAGELRRLKDTVRSAYLFTKVFAQYPERRVQAYLNYQFLGVKADDVLALATTDAERANIYAIEGFSSPQLTIEPLKKVYALNPASPMVGVLLIREINKLEEYYLTGALRTGPHVPVYNFDASMRGQKNNSDTVRHIQLLKEFCLKLAADKKYPEPEVGTLGAAYLAWMQNNTAEASDILKTLYGVKLKPEFDDQKQVIQLLLTAQTIQKYNRINEVILLPALQWLNNKARAESKADSINGYEYSYHPFNATERNFYEEVLAPLYLRQQDTTMAALSLATSGYGVDFWQNKLHSDNIRTLLRWKNAAPNPFVSFLVSRANADGNYLNELLGTTYLREHQYARAVNALKRVEPAYISRRDSIYDLADPFIELINDYPKVYTYGKAKGYTKLQFAEAMAALQLKIKSDPDNAASYYYKMGTGLYNTSTYGNAWYLISYNWSSNDFCRKASDYYDADYIKASNAEEYFALARKFGKTAEFKAKCTFMAAKCRQKQSTAPPDFFPGDDRANDGFYRQLRGNSYFTELKNDYKRTAFYKRAVGECTYLKDFIGEK